VSLAPAPSRGKGSDNHAYRKFALFGRARRPRVVNEPANRPGRQIYFGIAAIDGHDTGLVCIFERNSPLLSHGLVVRQHPQNTLVRSLVHASRLDRRSAARSPFEPSAQLLDTTRDRP